MNSLSNFQFHKFNINSQRNFYKSNDFNNRLKSRTNPDGFYNNYHENNNRYINDIPTNFSQENPHKKNNMNVLQKISQDKFPSKKILNSDFESLLKYGDSNKIDELLPHMIYNDLSFAKNNHLRLALSRFQTLLKYLFSQQQDLLNKNNKIESMFNNKNSNMNNKIRQLENDEYKFNEQLKSNKKQIDKINEKIKKYKNILNNSGKGFLIPNNYPARKIYNKDGLYRCQICFGRTFKTFEEFQEHYIKEHTNNKTQMNNNYNINNNITKSYLDNKLNVFENKMKNIILNAQNQNSNEPYNNTNNSEKFKPKTNNNIKMSNFNLLNNEEENINAHLNRLEYEQKEQYEQLYIKMNQMKDEFFKEIRNIKYKQPQINKGEIPKELGNIKINPPQINNNILNKNDEEKIINVDKTNNNITINLNSQNNINDNTNETINLIYNNQNLSANKNSQKIESNENNQKTELNEFKNDSNNIKVSDNNNNENNKINNEKNEQLNTIPPINNEINEPKNNEFGNNIIENPNIENGPINIINNDINKKEQNEQINIKHSTGKYIDKSKIIQEESGTLHNLTQNNNTNNQDNTVENKEEINNDKIFTNTGDSVVKSQVKLFSNSIINNPNEPPKFSVLQNKLEENEFINKIKERDENLLLDKNKNMEEIEEDYEAIKLKNLSLIEKKEEELIKQKLDNYFDEDNKNLGKEDYEKIIKNIIANNNKNMEQDKNYKEFFNNLIKKNELTELMIDEIKISNLNITQSKNKINETNNFGKSGLSFNNFSNNLEKNLGKGNYEDFL